MTATRSGGPGGPRETGGRVRVVLADDQTVVRAGFRALLDLPPEVEVPLVTPLGYPEEFPQGLPPAVAAIRRPWRALVHDEAWGRPRAAG